MSEDIDPNQHSDSKWTRALKKRDAEIERLRKLILPKIAEAGQWQEKYEEIARLKDLNQRLISALRDMQDDMTLEQYNAYSQLIQEATKDE